MKFNVMVRVVDVVEAVTAEAALSWLRTKLSTAGFTPYEPVSPDPGDVFESDDNPPTFTTVASLTAAQEEPNTSDGVFDPESSLETFRK